MKALIFTSTIFACETARATGYGNPVEAPSGGGASLLALAAVILLPLAGHATWHAYRELVR